jgi:hypothetical protein
MRTIERLATTLLFTLATSTHALGDDGCDKTTRTEVLAKFADARFTQLEPTTSSPTHQETKVEGKKLFVETVWDADEGTLWLKGERLRYATFELSGPGCRRLTGTVGTKPKQKAWGVLSESFDEIRFSYVDAVATDAATGAPYVWSNRLVRR